MGWHGGGDIMLATIETALETGLAPAMRRSLYKGVGRALREQDWHDAMEVMGVDPAYDRLQVEQAAGNVELNIEFVLREGRAFYPPGTHTLDGMRAALDGLLAEEVDGPADTIRQGYLVRARNAGSSGW